MPVLKGVSTRSLSRALAFAPILPSTGGLRGLLRTVLKSLRIGRARKRQCNLVFLMDRGYVEAFKVFCFSIRQFIDQHRPNIVVYTNDPAIKEDPALSQLVSRFVIITDQDIAAFQRISNKSVAVGRRLDFIAKYTLLKFLVFRDIGLDDFIFLDCDMIALDENINFWDIMPEDADFAACPAAGIGTFGLQSGAEARRANKELRARSYDKLRQLAQQDFGIERAFNSGLFYAKRACLGDETVRGLIRTAESQDFSLEQTATHQYFKTRTDLRFKSLPIWWNFTYLPCELIGESRFRELQPLIKILHYNRKKPWDEDAPQTWLFQIWKDYQERSRPWLESLVQESPSGSRSASGDV